MSKYYKTLSIGALTGFSQAPHPDARMVLGSLSATPTVAQIEHAGWLMPQMGEVDEKTRRFEEAKRRRAARQIAGRVAQRWADARQVQVHPEGEAS